MKKNLRHWVAAAVGTAAAFAFSSCAYDPYYSSVGGSYSSGYGEGYGYGGSNFSTSLFVTTGDPRWGYDPYCYSYYDYRSRRYYDPYLNGYYPIGYRPPIVYGAPHPYGWRPGRGYCPPPRTVRNITVVNYRDRESAYRNSNYSWSRQVRQRPAPQYRQQELRRDHNSYARPDTRTRQSSDNSWLNPQPRQSSESFSRQRQDRHSSSQSPEPRSSGRRASQLPPSYNSPVTSEMEQNRIAEPRRNTRPDFRQSTGPEPRQIRHPEPRQSASPELRQATPREATPAVQPGNRRESHRTQTPRDIRSDKNQKSNSPGDGRPGLRSLGDG